MEYYKDLHKKPEPIKFNLIGGILFILIAITSIIIRLDEGISIFWWFYSVFFFLYGMVMILQYRGVNVDRIFGKKFIRITSENIYYKPTYRTKEQKMNWNKIKNIKFNINSVEFESQTSILKISYHQQEYKYVKELKDTILQNAEEKNIPVEINY